MTPEALVATRCDEFIARFRKLIDLWQQHLSVRPDQTRAILTFIRRFDREMAEKLRSFDRSHAVDPVASILVSSTLMDARHAAAGIGSARVTLLLWQLEKHWTMRGYRYSPSLQTKLRGFLYAVWGLSSGYSTKPLRLLTLMVVLWILTSLALIAVRPSPTTSADVYREIYTAFSVIVSIGDVLPAANSGIAYYVVLIAATGGGIFAMVSLLSIVGVYLLVSDQVSGKAE